MITSNNNFLIINSFFHRAQECSPRDRPYTNDYMACNVYVVVKTSIQVKIILT